MGRGGHQYFASTCIAGLIIFATTNWVLMPKLSKRAVDIVGSVAIEEPSINMGSYYGSDSLEDDSMENNSTVDSVNLSNSDDKLDLDFSWSQDRIKNSQIEEDFYYQGSCDLFLRDFNATKHNFLNTMRQEDPELIHMIRKCLILPPPLHPERTQKNMTELKGEFGQPLKVDEMLGNKTDGFFVEVGAYNNATASNTLFFEQERNWSGLLIEPNKQNFDLLQSLRRNTLLLNACLATKPKPQVVKFDGMGIAKPNRVLPRDVWKQNATAVGSLDGIPAVEKMQCLPLYSIIMALGNPVIDALFVDVDGADFAVLRNVPLDKLNINMINIEVHWLGKIFEGTQQDLEEFLQSQGYQKSNAVFLMNSKEHDVVYVKNEMHV